MCNCKVELANRLKEEHNFEKAVPHYEIFSGKTYTNFTVLEVGKKKEIKIPVLHVYCPFCGKEYD